MSTPLENFAAAHKAYEEARTKVAGIATIIRDASAKLNDLGKVQVSNIESPDGYIRPPIGTYSIDAATWPTARNIHDALVALQRTHSALLAAYSAIPDETKSAVQKPRSI